MQQVITRTIIRLVSYNNDTNFPNYYENKNSPLFTKTNIMDVLPSHNYSQGLSALKDQPLIFENLLYLYISSITDSTFYYSLNDTNIFIQTKEFKYNNNIPLNNIIIYNGNLEYDGYNFNNINNISSNIEYFYLSTKQDL